MPALLGGASTSAVTPLIPGLLPAPEEGARGTSVEPTKGILRVVERLGLGGELERAEGIHHDGQLFGALGAQTLLHGAGVRAVGDAAGVEREGADLDAAPAAEVAIDVIQHLVGVYVAVVVGHRDGQRV